MIDFTRAFDSAWERMHVILFRPFDFGKWCAIGLSAFLAGLLQGGNGFNGGPNGNSFNPNTYTSGTTPNNLNIPGLPGGAQKFDIQQFNSSLAHVMASMQVGLIILIAVLVIAFFFGVALLLYWLGARGQFMFLDNIVRNRGAIAWPWAYYRRQANSLFLFYLLFFAVSLVVVLFLIGGAALVAVPLIIHKERPSGGEIGLFVVIGILYLLFCIVFYFVTFIFRELGVPLMFRNGLMARAAFFESMGLVARFPGMIALFILLRIAIFIAVIVLSLIICCVTLPFCCLGQWPYVGTVLLLPVLVYVKCFTLDCLAQLGPQYDVWTVDLPPTAPGGQFPPISPPLPPL